MDPHRRSPALDRVLRSAARLQSVLPDAVLVDGAAAAWHAGHRDSFDHDHVLSDLAERYEQVLEAVEATEGWSTSVRASSPPMTLLGSLGGLEAGLRLLRRTRPLETELARLDDGLTVTVPTAAETLRVKAYLVVMRNVVRDYLDVVALADRGGVDASAAVLAGIDDFYRGRSGEPDSVLTSLVLALSEPRPRDTRTIRQLSSSGGLAERWRRWSDVTAACQELADAVFQRVEAADE